MFAALRFWGLRVWLLWGGVFVIWHLGFLAYVGVSKISDFGSILFSCLVL